MNFLFELLDKNIGFSRSGRISISKEDKNFLFTPNVIIPINSVLISQVNFFEEFLDHKAFIINSENYLKENFIHEKFRSSLIFFEYKGSFEEFENIIEKNLELFYNENIKIVIPFNIPNTGITKEFLINEIEYFLIAAERILNKYQDFDFGITIKLFDYPDLIDLYLPLIKKKSNIKVLYFSDLFDNIKNFRNIIKTIIKTKNNLDNNLVLIASGRITSKFFPILIYLGFDFIDCTYSLYLSSENFYDTIEYLLPIYKIDYLPCSCVACKGKLKELLKQKYSPAKISILCLHNLILATNYINKVKQYLKYEDFRAFVEKSCLDNTYFISILKILDKEYYEIIKYETPLTQKNTIVNCHGPISYNRPDFQLYREMAIKNFTPESETKLIILLPCSSKKPYSESKSHQIFSRAIRKFPEFPSFQEIILTSPLGAIPRQLENIYPINSYDISVTGDWDEEELSIASNMLINILNKYNKDIPVLCHLEGGYLEIVKKAQKRLLHNFFFTEIQNNLTSKDSINSLEELISKNLDVYEPILNFNNKKSISKSWQRKIIKLLDYQFGLSSGSKILSNGLIYKKMKNNTQITLLDQSSKESLGKFDISSGEINLSLSGAKRLIPYQEAHFLVFDGEQIKGNTLFRPGIIEFSDDLIPNQHVIILDKSKMNIIAIGRMIVGSNFLKNSTSGRIAKIYESK